MAHPSYDHRQTGIWYVYLVGFIAVFTIVPATFARDGDALGSVLFGIALTIILGLVYAAFMSLRTTIEDGEVHVRFSFGRPHRRIPIEAITTHEPVRNPWWYGWGPRLIPGGVLYAVWGRAAVEVRYQDRGRDRMFRIGTDDAKGLDRALAAARSGRR